MATTTVASMAGILDVVSAEAMHAFQTGSVCFGAVWTQATAPGTITVRFPALAGTARKAWVAAHTEGASITGYQSPISAADATLAEYVQYSPTSLLTLAANPGAAAKIGGLLGQQVANTVDHNIAYLISGCSTNTITSTDGTALADLWAAVGKIQDNGYMGQLTAILHPNQYYGPSGLAANLLGTATPQTTSVQDQLMRAGWVNRIGPVDIFVSNQVQAYSTYYRGAVLAKEAIGLAYADPLIQVRGGFEPSIHAEGFSAASYHKAVLIDELGVAQIVS